MNLESHILFKSYLSRENPIFRKNSSLSQKGGGSVIKLTYNDETFTFHEHDFYWILNNKEGSDCVVVAIDSEHQEAYINNINEDTLKCGNTILSSQGSHLLKITLRFLNDNKKRLNIRLVKVTDNAAKLCGNKYLNLALFLTLLTGETWYGKYGFRPWDSVIRSDFRYNRDIMNKTRLNDIDFKIILQVLYDFVERNKIQRNQYDYVMNIYNTMKHDNPLVKDLLSEIFNKTKYNFICDVFYTIRNDLVFLLKLRTTWNELYALVL